MLKKQRDWIQSPILNHVPLIHPCDSVWLCFGLQAQLSQFESFKAKGHLLSPSPSSSTPTR